MTLFPMPGTPARPRGAEASEALAMNRAARFLILALESKIENLSPDELQLYAKMIEGDPLKVEEWNVKIQDMPVDVVNEEGANSAQNGIHGRRLSSAPGTAEASEATEQLEPDEAVQRCDVSEDDPKAGARTELPD